jgi:hypothetical protein
MPGAKRGCGMLYTASAVPSVGHLREDEWERLACGEMTGRSAETALEHVTRCAECARIFRGLDVGRRRPDVRSHRARCSRPPPRLPARAAPGRARGGGGDGGDPAPAGGGARGSGSPSRRRLPGGDGEPGSGPPRAPGERVGPAVRAALEGHPNARALPRRGLGRGRGACLVEWRDRRDGAGLATRAGPEDRLTSGRSLPCPAAGCLAIDEPPPSPPRGGLPVARELEGGPLGWGA